MRKVVVLSMMLLLWISAAKGQEEQRMTAEQVLAEMDSPTFVPTVKVSKVMHEGDSIQYMEMNNVYVYPQLRLKTNDRPRTTCDW